MKIERIIRKYIEQELVKPHGPIVLVIGQRQVGKTFLLKEIASQKQNVLYFDFEDIDVRLLFQPSVSRLEQVVGSRDKQRILLLDEIQHLKEAGSVLKIIHDHFPQTKVVVTGSAAFLLLKNIGDSLYGRFISFYMFPFTMREMVLDLPEQTALGGYQNIAHKPQIDALTQTCLVYGSLPAVFLEKNLDAKMKLLRGYLDSLLFKDIFEIEGIRDPESFKRLLKLLAFQVGGEVNPNELAQSLGINRKTVLEYIYLYEKFCIVKILTAFSSNARKEISKKFKVYFCDLGIRNAVIDNFMPLSSRDDKDRGGLFENYVFNLIWCGAHYSRPSEEFYFWRSFSGSEVDIVIKDVQSGKLTPVEVKYQKMKKPSSAFLNAYGARVEKPISVARENVWQFI